MAKLQDKDFDQVSGGTGEDVQRYQEQLDLYIKEKDGLVKKFLESSSNDNKDCILQAIDNLSYVITETQEKINIYQKNL